MYRDGVTLDALWVGRDNSVVCVVSVRLIYELDKVLTVSIGYTAKDVRKGRLTESGSGHRQQKPIPSSRDTPACPGLE